MEKDIEEWIKKIEKTKKGDVDLSRDEDLSIAIMNLVSLEEYLDLLLSVREIRKKMLGRIVTDPVGEEWCISKHLLAGSMRLYEVGCKELSKKGKKEAEPFFRAGFDLWSTFFALNLKLIKKEEIIEENAEKETKHMSRFSALMKKIVDCCKEW